MNLDLARQLLDEFLPAMEASETQCAAIRQLLKDRGLATDEELTPYLEQAGNAAYVRWRAVRVRIEYLLASAGQESESSDAEAKVEVADEPGEPGEPESGDAEAEKSGGQAEKNTSAEAKEAEDNESSQEKSAPAGRNPARPDSAQNAA